MRTATKRELNQNTAAVLGQAEDGDVVITERGRPKWRIARCTPAETGLDRLAAVGAYTPPAAAPVPWGEEPEEREYASHEVTSLLAEQRVDHS